MTFNATAACAFAIMDELTIKSSWVACNSPIGRKNRRLCSKVGVTMWKSWIGRIVGTPPILQVLS